MKTSIIAFCLTMLSTIVRAHHTEGPPTVPRVSLEELDLGLQIIPAGSFTMGSPESEKGRDSDEDQVEVTITRDFEMMATEVTQRQWVLVMNSNPSHFKKEKHCPESHTVLNGQALCPNHPVERVSWIDAQDFIKKLNYGILNLRGCHGTPQDAEGCFRLPTEAEWEHAARGGSSKAYHFGDSPGSLESYAWFGENSGNQTRPVAQKWHNPHGLHDMHGNVWEWTQDWYGEKLIGGKDPMRSSSGAGRVLRGGGWNHSAGNVRSAYRGHGIPSSRNSPYGFRLTRTR